MAEYYNQLAEATEKGDLRKSTFALVTDRFLMWGGRKQVYGSQIIEGGLYPVRDSANLNTRRLDGSQW